MSPFARQVRQADGSVQATFFDQPAFGKGSDGKRRQSDNGLAETPDSTQDAAVADRAFKPLRFGRSASKLVELGLDEGPVRLGSKDLKLGKPERSVDGALLYRDVARDTDLKLAPAGAGVRTELVLKSASAPTSFTFDLSDPKGQLGDGSYTASGGYRFTSPVDDGVQLELGTPFAYSVDVAHPGYIAGGEAGSALLDVQQIKNGFTITKTVNPAWLKGKNFPVVLDPAVTYSAATAPVVDCTIINNELVNTNLCGTTNLEIGYGSGTGTAGALRRMLFFFGGNNDGKTITPGSTIDSASLQLTMLKNYQPANPVKTVLSAYQQAASWFDTATWNSSRVVTNATTGAKTLTPWANGAGAGSTPAAAGTKQPSGAALPTADNSPYNLDVTAAAKSWASGATYMGLQVRMDDENTASTRVFAFGSRLGASSTFPKYVVNYTPPTTPVISKTSAPAVTAADYATPALAGLGLGSDPAGTAPKVYGRGQAVVYTVKVTNPASVAQSGIKVNDPLDPALKILPGSLSGCPSTAVCQLNQAGPGLQVNNLTLGPGGVATLTYTAVADNTVDRACTAVNNTATVTTIDNTTNSATSQLLVCDQALGLEPWWSYAAPTTLGPQASAQVNVATGNLVAQQVDSTPTQAHGKLSMVLRRTYNSQDTTVAALPGSVGVGWQLNFGEAGDAVADGLSPTALSVPRLSTVANPLPVVLVDRDGTRHTYTNRTITTTTSTPAPVLMMSKDSSGKLVAAANAPAALLPQLLGSALDLAKFTSVCVDSTYSPPPGVHAAMWRYIGVNSGATAGCASASGSTGLVNLGYVLMRPDRLRSEFSWDGRLLAMIDPSGVQLRYKYAGTNLQPLPLAGVEVGPLEAIYEYRASNCTTPVTTSGVAPALSSACRAYRFSYATLPATTVGGVPTPARSTTSIVDPAGRTTTYTMDAATRHLIGVTNPTGGGSWGYSYSGIEGGSCGQASLGQLCSVTDPRGTTTSFTYTPAPASQGGPARIASVTDRRGTTTTLAYPSPTAVTATRAGNRITSFSSIDSTGRAGRLEHADTAGTLYDRTVFGWDGAGGLCRQPDLAVDNNLCTVIRRSTFSGTDAADTGAQITRSTFNDQGQPVQIDRTNPAGGVDRTSYGYSLQAVAPSGSSAVLTDEIRADGHVQSAARPAATSLLYTVSDPVAVLPPRGAATGGPAGSACVNTQPCASYLTVTLPDNNAAKAPNASDPNALPCSNGGGATANTGLVCAVLAPSYDGSTTAPAGSIARSVTKYAYNTDGQRTRMTTPLAVATAGTGTPASYSYGYYGDGDTDLSGTARASGWLKTVTDPYAKFIAYGYDSAGNTVRTWDRAATDKAGSPAAAYPASAPVSAAYAQTLYGEGDPSDLANGPLAKPWRYVRSVRDPVGNTSNTCVDLNGNPNLSRSARGSNGSPILSCAAALAAPGAYDTLYDTTSPAGAAPDDRPLSVLKPEEAARNGAAADTAARTGYNAYGEVASTTDPAGAVTTYAYDGAGRQTGKAWTRGASPSNSDGTPTGASAQCNPGTPTTAADAPLPTGRIKCTSTTTYDTFAQPTSSTDAAGATTLMSYDRLGRMTQKLAPRSFTGAPTLTTVMTYDADGHTLDVCSPRQFTEGDGTCTSTSPYATHTSYDPAGRPATSTTYRTVGSPLAATMRYDADGNMTASTDPRGTVPVKAANGTTSPVSVTVTTSYDLLDRKTSSSTARDTSTTLTTRWVYNASGDLLAQAAPGEAGDNPGGPAARITGYSYDPDHRALDTVTALQAAALDPGTISGAVAGNLSDAAGQKNLRSRVHYDADGNIDARYSPRAFTSTSNSGTAALLAAPDDRFKLIVAFDRDARPSRQDVPRGDSGDSLLNDPLTNPSSDPQALQCAPGRPGYSATTQACRTSLRYDTVGRVSQVLLPTGTGDSDTSRSLSYRYTDDSLRAASTAPSPTGSGTVTTAAVTYDGAGRPVATTNANGHTDTARYSADGLVLQTETAAGSGYKHTTVSSYNANGQPVRVATPRGQDTPVAVTSYTADGLAATSSTGQTIVLPDPAGDPAALDAALATGPLIGTVGGTGPISELRTGYTYDNAGQAVEVYSPAASARQAPNTSGTPVRNSYTPDRLLASTATPSSESAGQLTDTRTASYSYDSAGRKTSANSSSTAKGDGGTQTFSYYPSDLLRGQTGRPVSPGTAGSSGGTSQTGTISHLYDAAGNTLSVSDSTSGVTVSGTYYADGQPRDTVTRGGSGSKAVARRAAWSYDGAGQVIARGAGNATDTDATLAASATRYTRNDAGVATKMTETTGQLTSTLAYNPLGQLTQQDRPHGTTQKWLYRADDLLGTTSVTSDSATASGTAVAAWNYDYDALGRKLTQTYTGRGAFAMPQGSGSGPRGSEGDAFGVAYRTTYDTAGRLSQFADARSTRTVSYDPDGNRTAYGDTSWTYNPDDTMSSSSTGGSTVRFGYDAVGRNTLDSCASITGTSNQTGTTCARRDSYDGFDRLISQTSDNTNTSPASYTYDGLDRQASMTTDSTAGTIALGGLLTGTTVYSYDGWTQTVEHQTNTPADNSPGVGTSELTNTITNAGAIATTRKTTAGVATAPEYLSEDGTGSTGLVTTGALVGATDPAGPLIRCVARYDAFGNPDGNTATAPTGSCASGSSNTDTFYRGNRKDTVTGNYQLGSRTYDPAKAAFLTPDDYRTGGSTANTGIGTDPLTRNTYTYVNGDPINGIDPSGHYRCDADDKRHGCLEAGQVGNKQAEASAAHLAAQTEQREARTAAAKRLEAAFLDERTTNAAYKGIPATTTRVTVPIIPGGGVVRGCYAIAAKAVGAPGARFRGDGSLPANASFQADSCRVAVFIDLDRGEAVFRQSPSCTTDGICKRGSAPEVGVSRSGSGFTLQVEAFDPLEPAVAVENVRIQEFLQFRQNEDGGLAVAGMGRRFPSKALFRNEERIYQFNEGRFLGLGFTNLSGLFPSMYTGFGDYQPVPQPGVAPSPPSPN